MSKHILSPNEAQAESNNFLKCRGCLTEAKETNMNSLFVKFEKDVTLAEIIEESIGYVITITEKKRSSQHLCKECTRILVDYVRFKNTFREATEYFKNLEHFIPKIDENTKDINCKKTDDDCQDANVSLSVSEIKFDNSDRWDLAEVDLKHQVTQSCQKAKVTNKIHCELCEKYFKSKLQLQRHKRIVHQKTNSKSKKQTNRNSTLHLKKYSADIKVHTRFKDSQCGLSSTKLCKVCKHEFPSEEFDYHLETHKNHICNICGRGFIRKTDLNDHQETHLDVCKYVCQHCGKSFKVRTALNKHKRIHTNPREEICESCGQRFNTRDNLKTHYKLKHIKSKDFQCNLCGLAFTLKSTLEKHIERHNPNRKKIYSCNVCNVSYINKYNLGRHQIIKHTTFEDRPTCEFCGKGYINKKDLVKHVKKHHGQNDDQEIKLKKLEEL